MVVVGSVFCDFMSAAFISVSMVFFCLMYLLVESVLVALCCCLGTGLWNMVYVGRWSERGGDMVPAVIGV